ncbi:NDFIP1 [Bugula neritina]|uniref:NDFIP1 n=1 Tax=Bugula neritina TaxID=10212 RepID=A0A7J7JZB3_BUGNE|nr:NDFIP1 [Bugula neritina]
MEPQRDAESGNASNPSEEVGPPPAYTGASSAEPAATNPSPPAYDIATKLPSYDEAEKCKADEAGVPLIGQESECPDRAAREARRQRQQRVFLWAGPGLLFSDARQDQDVNPDTISHAQLRQQVLGTELEFLCCFLVALLFNWIGLFAALCCLTVTIAGRAGAVSGFGLSVVKWSFLVMSYITHSSWGLNTTETSLSFFTSKTSTDPTELTLKDNKWFSISCWLIVGLVNLVHRADEDQEHQGQISSHYKIISVACNAC